MTIKMRAEFLRRFHALSKQQPGSRVSGSDLEGARSLWPYDILHSSYLLRLLSFSTCLWIEGWLVVT
jgi:hypothetical protein